MKYVYFATKQQKASDKTRRSNKAIKVSVKYSEENSVLGGNLLLEYIHSSGWGGDERLFEYDCEVEGGGHLFEAVRLLTFSAFRMGAYSRWALIRGWALIRINTVF